MQSFVEKLDHYVFMANAEVEGAKAKAARLLEELNKVNSRDFSTPYSMQHAEDRAAMEVTHGVKEAEDIIYCLKL